MGRMINEPVSVYVDHENRNEFISKVKNVETFSDPKFFNTVFVTGDDMVAEEKAMKQREIDEWNKKIVVANKHFFVNTKPQGSHQMDKYNSLREGKVQKT